MAANPLELLRYRSNLLGADLRITNFGGGNTSSKLTLPDPLTGEPVRVLAVKGSGGDLRSIGAPGFALLYLRKLEQLIARYRGEAHEDEMVAFYPLCAFGENRVAASIDTPLHAFLPFDHVDHLHPDWCIALAASANGERKLAEFNARYGASDRLAAMAAAGFRARDDAPCAPSRPILDATACCSAAMGCSPGAIHSTSCYVNSIKTIDQMGEFIEEHAKASGRPRFGGAARDERRRPRVGRRRPLLPQLRGAVSSNRRVIAHFDRSDEALDVCEFTMGRRAQSAGHELSRSLPADAHLSDVRAVGSRS